MTHSTKAATTKAAVKFKYLVFPCSVRPRNKATPPTGMRASGIIQPAGALSRASAGECPQTLPATAVPPIKEIRHRKKIPKQEQARGRKKS